MTDPDTITYQALSRTGTTLYGLVGTSVDFAITPDGFDNTSARVVFRPEDGQSMKWRPTHERSYLVECYGGANDGWESAKAVYDAVHEAWHEVNSLTVAAGVLMSGWEEAAGVPLVHPKTRHEYIVCRIAGKYRGA